MDHERFRDWFSHVDDLTVTQRAEVAAALSERPQGAASLAAIELGVDDERRCPHRGSGGAVSRGMARGLRRYRCKACGKTFGAFGAVLRAGAARAASGGGVSGSFLAVLAAAARRDHTRACGRCGGPAALGVDDGEPSSRGLGASAGWPTPVLDPFRAPWPSGRYRVLLGWLAPAGARRVHRMVSGCPRGQSCRY